MSLVDGQEPHVEATHDRLERVELESLRGDEENVQTALGGGRERRSPLVGALVGAQVRGTEARRTRPPDLILHERDERRHHQREPPERERRHLVADALSPARGQNAERIAPGEDGPDEIFLSGPEGRIAQMAFEQRDGIDVHDGTLPCPLGRCDVGTRRADLGLDRVALVRVFGRPGLGQEP